MESSQDPISVRVNRLNADITSAGSQLQENGFGLVHRECLLDALQVLYDECSIDTVRKFDTNVSRFCNRFRGCMERLRSTRVNLADFEIRALIGRGYFGDVHVVCERQTGDMYALKSVKKSNSLDKMCFENERNIMACIRDISNDKARAWITGLRYAFQDASNLFFVMDYHPGGDLAGLLERQGGTLPQSAATFYLAELTLALEALHELGFVHRDIKPDNILLDRLGHIRLADFGSAAKLNCNGEVEFGVSPVGTPHYLAPEVLEALEGNSTYGPDVDFWSMGIVGYELVVGNVPFTGATTAAIYSKIMDYKQAKIIFPPELVLSVAYIDFIGCLLTESKRRLNAATIRDHSLFADKMCWCPMEMVRQQVPPYVPKLSDDNDISNFSCERSSRQQSAPKGQTPINIDNFKRKTHFSGRNLPFIGFTYTPITAVPITLDSTKNLGSVDDDNLISLESNIEQLKLLKQQNDELKTQLMQRQTTDDSMIRQLEEKTRKLNTVETVRTKLEKELADAIAKCSTMERTLNMERKDHAEMERKALEIIHAARQKWERHSQKSTQQLQEQLHTQKQQIDNLTHQNNMLNEQLDKALDHGNRLSASMKKLQSEHSKREVASDCEAVERLGRRSVMGLECRIDRMLNEHQQEIVQLRELLNLTQSQRQKLEMALDVARTDQNKTQTELDAKDSQIDKLRIELDQARSEVVQLKADMQMQQINFKHKLDQSENEIKETKEMHRLTQTKLESCMVRAQNAESNAAVLKQNASDMGTVRATIELRLKNIEDSFREERERNEELQSQLEALKSKSIEILDQRCTTDEIRELRTKCWRVERDLNNAKLDRRIVERELKESIDEKNNLKAQIEKLQLNLVEMETKCEHSIFEINDINERLTMEALRDRDTIKMLNVQLDEMRNHAHHERILIEELNKNLKEKDDRISDSIMRERTLQESINQLNTDNIAKTETIWELDKKLGQLKLEKDSWGIEKSNIEQQLSSMKLNWEALKEACTLLEAQVIEYERINNNLIKEKDVSHESIQKLMEELCHAKENTNFARRDANEERSFRALAEFKSKQSEEEIEKLRTDMEIMQDKYDELREFSNQLTNNLSSTEMRCSELLVDVENLQRNLDICSREKEDLGDDLEQSALQISHFKFQNCTLTMQLDEEKRQRMTAMQRLESLERQFKEQEHLFKERDWKREATIGQQTKLINYLQAKIEEYKANKKKTLTDKIFGSCKKENIPPQYAPTWDSQSSSTRKTTPSSRKATPSSDMHTGNNKQKNRSHHVVASAKRIDFGECSNNSKSTTECRNERKNQCSSLLSTPSSHAQSSESDSFPTLLTKNGAFSDRSDSQHCSVSSTESSAELHDFKRLLCIGLFICERCSKRLMPGKPLARCVRCHLRIHQECVNTISEYCNFNVITKSIKSLQSMVTGDELYGKILAEGWLRIIDSSDGNLDQWPRRFVQLRDNGYLCLYSEVVRTHKPHNGSDWESTKPIKMYTLKAGDGHAALEPLCSEVPYPYVGCDGSDELTRILKIDTGCQNSDDGQNNCKPATAVFLLSDSIQDRHMWYLALQDIFTGLRIEKDKNKNNTTPFYTSAQIGSYQTLEPLLTMDSNTFVNYVTDVGSGWSFVGTNCGLFALRTPTSKTMKYDCEKSHTITPLPLQGLIESHQMTIMKSEIRTHPSHRGELIVMLVNDDFALMTCELRELLSMAQCGLKVMQPLQAFNVLPHLNGVHFIRCHEELLAIGTTTQLILARYEWSCKDFVVIRSLDTATPVTSVTFDPVIGNNLVHDPRVLVCADKLFVVETKHEPFDSVSKLVKTNNVIQSLYKIHSQPLTVLLTRCIARSNTASLSQSKYNDVLPASTCCVLACFNECCLMIDAYNGESVATNAAMHSVLEGKSCAKFSEISIRSQHPPIGFHYTHPLLYIAEACADYSEKPIVKTTAVACVTLQWRRDQNTHNTASCFQEAAFPYLSRCLLPPGAQIVGECESLRAVYVYNVRSRKLGLLQYVALGQDYSRLSIDTQSSVSTSSQAVASSLSGSSVNIDGLNSSSANECDISGEDAFSFTSSIVDSLEDGGPQIVKKVVFNETNDL